MGKSTPTGLALALTSLASGACVGERSDISGPGDPRAPPYGVVSGRASYLQAGVGSVSVALRGPSGSVLEATTPSSGIFSFEGLDEGRWAVEVTPPSYFTLLAVQPPGGLMEVTAGETVEVDVLLTPPQDPGRRLILIKAHLFEPERIAVLPGTWILWVNQSGARQSITPDGHAEWTAAVIGAGGETFGAVMNNPGNYPFFSEFGEADAMRGMIVVDRP